MLSRRILAVMEEDTGQEGTFCQVQYFSGQQESHRCESLKHLSLLELRHIVMQNDIEKKKRPGHELTVGILNTRWLSRFEIFVLLGAARADFYSQRCRCYHEDASSGPRSPWYKSVIYLGSVSTQFTQPQAFGPRLQTSWRGRSIIGLPRAKKDAQCNSSLVPRLNVMVTVAIF